MKKMTLLSAFAAILFGGLASASDHMTCQIDPTFGDVTLEKVLISGKSSQKIVAYIGKETWKEPTKYRRICETLKEHITSQVNEEWIDYGCDGTLGLERKVFDFSLSLKGQRLLPWYQQIRFLPVYPIQKDFLRTYINNSCDPL